MNDETTEKTKEIRDVKDLPPEFRPISAWGYVGYELLFSIPFVGLIILIVFACGGHSNKNVRNFAISFFCMILLTIIIGVIFAVTGIGVFAALGKVLTNLS